MDWFKEKNAEIKNIFNGKIDGFQLRFSRQSIDPLKNPVGNPVDPDPIHVGKL